MLLSSHLQLFAATTAFVVNVIAQTCNNPIFIVCTAPTNNVKPLSGTSGSQISDPTLFDWGSLDSVSSLPIGKRQLLPRQTTDENAVCCNPDIDCLVLQNIPFCYVSLWLSYPYPKQTPSCILEQPFSVHISSGIFTQCLKTEE